MNRNFILTLRWISVLPFSILMLFLVPFILFYLEQFQIYLYGRSGDGAMMKYIIPLIANAAAGYAYIIFASYTAPSYKKMVCFILLILLLLFCGYMLINTFQARDYISLSQTICIIVGAVSAYIQVEKKSYETN